MKPTYFSIHLILLIIFIQSLIPSAALSLIQVRREYLLGTDDHAHDLDPHILFGV